MRKTLFQRETEGKALEIHRGSDGMTEKVEKEADNALRSNTGLQVWGSLPAEQNQKLSPKGKLCCPGAGTHRPALETDPQCPQGSNSVVSFHKMVIREEIHHKT